MADRPARDVIWNFTRYAITTRDGFGEPWRHLQHFVPDSQVESSFLGAIYFAWGSTREPE